MRRVATRLAGAVGVAAILGAGAAGATANFSGPLRMPEELTMVGNPHEFPDLSKMWEFYVAEKV